MAKMSQEDKDTAAGYVSKKCHSCYTYVPLNADECPYCKVKLGSVGPHGMAEKLTDWKGYAAAAVAILVFLIFCFYAFL